MGVDLELKIPRAKGIPEGSLISIRVGSVRRQAVYGSDRPYRFQGPNSKSEMMKVDVYMPIGTATLFVDTLQNQASWKQDLKIAPEARALCGDEKAAAEMSIDLDMNIGDLSQPNNDTGNNEVQPQKAPDRPMSAITRESSAKRHQVAIEAQPYFEQHEVLDVLRELLQVLIKEQPEDPYGFMIQVLENSRKARLAGKRQPQAAPAGKPKRPQTAGRIRVEPGDEGSAASPEPKPEPSVPSPATPEPLEPKAADASSELSAVAAPAPPDSVAPQPPLEQLLPMLPAVSAASSAAKGEPPLSKQDELAALQHKVRSCLTAKVQDGALEQILADCGFGLITEEEEVQAEVKTFFVVFKPGRMVMTLQEDGLVVEVERDSLTHLKGKCIISVDDEKFSMELLRARAGGSKEYSVVFGEALLPPPPLPPPLSSRASGSVQDVARDDETEAQVLLDVAKDCRADLEDKILSKSSEGPSEELQALRERICQKMVEKEQAGELEPILRKLVSDDSEEAKIQQAAVEETRLALQTAFVQKFMGGELNAIFDAVTGTDSTQQGASAPSRPPKPEQKAEEKVQELEVFRERLRNALTNSIEQGSLPGLLTQAYTLSSQPSPGNTQATASDDKASSSAVKAVQARYVGPADGASSSAIPLGAVVSASSRPPRPVGSTAAEPVEAASTQPRESRQGSWCSEVDRLKGQTQFLDARTSHLEFQVRQLLGE